MASKRCDRNQVQREPLSEPSLRESGAPREEEGSSPYLASLKPKGGAISPDRRRQILKEVHSGRSVRDLERHYGVHNTTIYGWIRQENGKQAQEPTAEVHPRPQEKPPEPSPAAVRETGRYTMDFKEDALSQVRSGRKTSEVARQYGIPEKTLQRWKSQAREAGEELPEPKSTRPTNNASPINEEHRTIVLSLKKDHPNMGPAQIQNQLKRFHALKVSRQMIGRIFAQAGILLEKRSPSDAEGDPSKNRFEMTRPNELWAVDFKEFWIHSQKVYALFLLDDFSRFCLGFALTESPTAELAIETVERAIQRYGQPERILSDRGPQFHAWNGVSQFDDFLGGFLIDHTVTKAQHAFTNGKLEAFNRSLEAELLQVEEFATLREAEEKIRAHVSRYNFSRTHMGIEGLVPADRYFGMVEEARRALEAGLKAAGPTMNWLRGLVSVDGPALREPVILELLLKDGRLELMVLGRRFTLG